MLPRSLVLLLAPHVWGLGLVAASEHSWQTWGPYRPNLYFGVRPQVPETLLMGLMWASGESQDSTLRTLRSTCEQDDGMEGYGWTVYDARTGGSQTMHDRELGIDLRTDFIKAENGESWAVRVVGTPRPGISEAAKTTVVFHVAMEKAQHDGDNQLDCKQGDYGLISTSDSAVVCTGDALGLGAHEIRLTGDNNNTVVQNATVISLQVPEDEIWQAKSSEAALDWDRPQAEVTARMDRVFPRAAPFHDNKYTKFSHSLLSNLLGGLGFFHGDSRVDYSNAPEYAETDPEFWLSIGRAKAQAPINTTIPTSLLTFTPSRPFFPRGFLWDEGFHLLPVLEWDLDLAVSVLQSWAALMDNDGWIGREQILGPEARTKVPEEFQVQYPQHANPPTLLLLLPKVMAKIANPSTYLGHPSRYASSWGDGTAMVRNLYRSFKRHYEWFRRTQAGNFTGAYPRPVRAVSDEGYRWRGRTPQHTFASGLDDYPRAEPPHPGELHVDALAWVGASARALGQVAEFLDERDDMEMFGKQLVAVKHNLDELHWDNEQLAYCDTTIQGIGFKRVCHPGYVSVLPLLLGLMDPGHPHLPQVLDAMSNPAILSSPHGLRSLSAKDPAYGTGENYWRGAVWMNLNVLAVLSLQEISLQGQGKGSETRSPHARALSLAGDLRDRLVRTVYDSWEKTGFVWEQYSDKTGEGSHSRAFTGWSACVLLLMGLELPEGTVLETEPEPERLSSSRSTTVLIGLGALVAVGMVFRRRMKPLVILAMHVGRVLQQYWVPGSGYQQVVDLEELDHGNSWRRSTAAGGTLG
ncbi:glycoside hydrolase [Thozetella sp. PMI_491]|nr:glycoside hydrolase [Thozetella sp. PMI_491]